MNINLTRDASGRILSNGNPVILRGGHYYIFKNNDKPGRCLVKAGKTNPFRVDYNAAIPCQNTTFTVQELLWDAEPWEMFFNHLNTHNCNFLRMWLTGGTSVSGTGAEPKPLDLTPFVRVQIGGKWRWQVYDAVVNGNWNIEYFRRLNAFVTAAENHGIIVQISLFNYFDLTRRLDDGNFRGWCRSPWNPTLSDHPSGQPNWANNHLVNAGGSGTFGCTDPTSNEIEKARQTFFVAPTNSLRAVQKKLVTKTVETLLDRTNVIYEIMNEPRGDHSQNAKFSSAVVSWIEEKAGTKRPLISVNAASLYLEKDAAAKTFDVDYWSDHPEIPGYDRIDAISYHALTGYGALVKTVCNKANQQVAQVNPGQIQKRFNIHRAKHPSKSLIYCTDAVRIGSLTHNYQDAAQVNHELEVRDGQIYTNYPNMNSDSALDQCLKSDLQNWAYWCFSRAVTVPGAVHFQNHSFNQMSYPRIIDGYNQAVASPMGAIPEDTDPDTT